MFGMQKHLKIEICQDADEATAKGHVYTDGTFKAAEIENVVVVRNGTESGNSTVDLVMRDEAGNKFVVMLTGALLKSIPC